MINENSVWQKKRKERKEAAPTGTAPSSGLDLWTQCESKHQIGFLTAWVGGQAGKDGK